MADFWRLCVVWLVMAAIASPLYDLYTYSARQTKWEKDHPGATYIRGYRKLERKSRKAGKKMGEI